MFLKPNSSFSFSTMQRDGLGSSRTGIGSSSSVLSYALTSQKGISSRKFMASVSKDPETVTVAESVIFRPFEEIKKDALVVPVDPRLSLARQFYSHDCEAALNEQIKSVFLFSTCTFYWLSVDYIYIYDCFTILVLNLYFLFYNFDIG